MYMSTTLIKVQWCLLLCDLAVPLFALCDALGVNVLLCIFFYLTQEIIQHWPQIIQDNFIFTLIFFSEF